MKRRTHGGLLVAALLGIATLAAAQDMSIDQVDRPDTSAPNDHYVGNRQPLLPSPFYKLPIGSIQAKGWLGHQLELMREGQVGQLMHLSQWLEKDGNAWLDPEGRGDAGWEELPYWLKGYGDLAYLLDDEGMIAEAEVWIEGILSTRAEDGWFGPRFNKTSLDGDPDLWPNMIALNCLQSYYEYKPDQRVLDLMAAYFQWELTVPDEQFMNGYWPAIRAGDNLESVYWLYNRTGDESLLELAHKIHRCMARWDEDVINWHGVNITQGFREPAEYYLLTHDPRHLEAASRNYDKVIGMYGQVPGGMFGADENARQGFDDPRQGAETCSMVEFMHSFQMLLTMIGDPIWADRCEEVAFNDFPASQTPDLKSLHYLTAPNMPRLDKENKSPGIQNGGTMLSYDPYGYRCCQHNVSHGWPYYAEHLWMATPGNGLAALLYAECEVRATVGGGVGVTITEMTDYPFSSTIRFQVEADRPVEFPLYLRIPQWCEGASVEVNGQNQKIRPEAGSYLKIDRRWGERDVVILMLPMTVQVERWEENHDSASVSRGPLAYSLAIQEEWRRYGGTDEFPALEVFPASPWNYGLVLDAENPSRSFNVEVSPDPLADQPFVLEHAPVKLITHGKPIPDWQLLPQLHLIDELQDSPVRSDQPMEEITLVPMGCARLRISAFPVIGDGPDAHEWVAPPEARHEASHRNDRIEAVSDDVEPENSGDQSIPRFTWWDHLGTEEWITYRFDEPTKVHGVEVYWFDDTGVGQCRVPETWRLEYRRDGEWATAEPKRPYGTEVDQYNRVEIEEIETTELRLVVQLQEGFSGGILEWRIF
ncbi:MAG: transcriptional initiation protein Tat [Armatimonadia bacterium]|nr:transcriptional initiation protein Tat [Armatimonadia bacterium]